MDSGRVQYPSSYDQPMYALPSYPAQVPASLTFSPPSEMDNSHLQHPSFHDQHEYVSPSFVDSTDHRMANTFAGSYDANPFGDFSHPTQPTHAAPSMIARPDGRPHNPYRTPEQPLAHAAMSYPLQLERPSPPETPFGSSYSPPGMTAAPVGAQYPSTTNPGQRTYAFVSLAGSTIRKRPRRRYDEAELMYSCSFEGCSKKYGTLNHLNAHVKMQKHGPVRHPSEFAELRKMWHQKHTEHAANHPHRDRGFGQGNEVPNTVPRASRLVSIQTDGYGEDDESGEEIYQSDDSQQQEERRVGQGSNSLPLPYNVRQGRFRSRSPNVGH